MYIPEGKRYIWDIETTGLLDYMRANYGDDERCRIHVLAIRDIDTGETHVFRKNKRMDSIHRGVKMLIQADAWIGHNLMDYDIQVLELLFPEEMAQAESLIRDTMLLSRVYYADVKEDDYRRHRRGEIEGKEIGRHGLEAWGQRLGMYKGDYAKKKMEELKAIHIDASKEELMRLVWAEWSQEMEDYCVQDLNVNESLFQKMQVDPRRHAEFAITLEHKIHNLMIQVTNNGFPFNMNDAVLMENEMRAVVEEKEKAAVEHFGQWWVPGKWKEVRKEYSVDQLDEEGNPVKDENGKVVKIKQRFLPREEYGEDLSRKHWGEVVMPKKTMRFKPGSGKPDREEGCPYCPVEITEFNPGSRPQIIDRLTKIYGWEPEELTEKGQPMVNDEILRDLAKTIPICEDLAELFYYNKRLGQLVDGKNGWIGKAMERGDCRIHPRFNVSGAVTNRATHSDPNIAQVPRVVFRKPKQWVEDNVIVGWVNSEMTYHVERVDPETGETYLCDQLTPLLGPDGKQIKGKPVYDENGDFVLEEDGSVKVKKVLMHGRAGDHGWDCRNLFTVPEGWILMGADQKGIELRALAHFMAEFDKGVYGDVVLNGDPHQMHADALEIDRDTAKTVIYALIYGAQDFKLGITVKPELMLKPMEAKNLGKTIRQRLMTRIPALGTVIKNIQRQAKTGVLDALDGRKLFVRAQHAALNTLLQGAGATIAKQWCVNFYEYCLEDGYTHGWDGDFAILAWIHDELQVAVRDTPEIRERMAFNIAAAAYDAGMDLGVRLPVDVDVKFGRTWAETH